MWKPEIRSIVIVIVSIIIVVSIVGVSAVYLLTRPRPAVGIIDINQSIIQDAERDFVADMVDYAEERQNIRAVMLKVDSPGGEAPMIEDIYRSLVSLRKKKPVVTSVTGMAASGGYFISLPSNYIFVEPSAFVGNVGVWATAPTTPILIENIIESGPYKLTGFSVKGFPFTIRTVHKKFLNTVENERGENLVIKREDLSRGLLYLGSEAVDKGLADFVGSTKDAEERAAEMAGIEDYKEVIINQEVEGPWWWKRFWWQETSKSEDDPETENARVGKPRWSDLTPDDLSRLNDPPTYYYLRLPSSTISQKTFPPFAPPDKEKPTGPLSEENTVLVDVSHMNAFKVSELNELRAELAERNFLLDFFKVGENLANRLKSSEAFLTVNPRIPFSPEEIVAVDNFVSDNGSLLLVSDPKRSDVGPINSLSTDFGLTFSPGFLYNMRRNYGVYRNIYLDEFRDGAILENLKKLVLFTSAPVSSDNGGLAFTDKETFLSTGEIPRVFSPAAISGENRVLALGDLSLLTRPWSTVENNPQFISILADQLIK